ncbi:MAG: TIGR02281 family clan AA aspartic protease [Methylobacteriaceae bacterium]|nr:TIGR02281 family clan AA aspartic protease [Methylobacteriaceae bacterium]MBV9244646.1 TIGR02281 family clan AA aspartic protease [Methylobacteriaceae bacterium]
MSGITSPLPLAMSFAVAMIVTGSMLSNRVQTPTAPVVAVPQKQAAPAAAAPTFTGGASVTLAADDAGHFHAEAEIEGHLVRMLVDTGASIVALRPEDAAAIGLRPMPSDYSMRLSTANGITTAAEVRIREIYVGGIVARDVPAVVLQPGLLTQSLLGMSFLKKIGSVRIDSGQLELRQ